MDDLKKYLEDKKKNQIVKAPPPIIPKEDNRCFIATMAPYTNPMNSMFTMSPFINRSSMMYTMQPYTENKKKDKSELDKFYEESNMSTNKDSNTWIRYYVNDKPKTITKKGNAIDKHIINVKQPDYSGLTMMASYIKPKYEKSDFEKLFEDK